MSAHSGIYLQSSPVLSYYPHPFVLSPYRGSLTTVWYLDYAHLLFWFFFFNLLTTALVLVFFFSGLAQNTESRGLSRETRGFSRAQTGDLITAAMPLTWSVTMIMQANTQSANFDENTSLTSFTFSVVGYQWGWNYFFPADVIHGLAVTPVRVGASGVFAPAGLAAYDNLRAQLRAEFLLRSAARGQYAGHGLRGTVGHAAALSNLGGLVMGGCVTTPGVLHTLMSQPRGGLFQPSLGLSPQACVAVASLSSVVSGDPIGDVAQQRAWLVSGHIPAVLAGLLATHPTRIGVVLGGQRVPVTTTQGVVLPLNLGGNLSRGLGVWGVSSLPTQAHLTFQAQACKDKRALFVLGNRLTLVAQHVVTSPLVVTRCYPRPGEVYTLRVLAALPGGSLHQASTLAGGTSPFVLSQVRLNPASLFVRFGLTQPAWVAELSRGVRSAVTCQVTGLARAGFSTLSLLDANAWTLSGSSALTWFITPDDLGHVTASGLAEQAAQSTDAGVLGGGVNFARVLAQGSAVTLPSHTLLATPLTASALYPDLGVRCESTPRRLLAQVLSSVGPECRDSQLRLALPATWGYEFGRTLTRGQVDTALDVPTSSGFSGVFSVYPSRGLANSGVSLPLNRGMRALWGVFPATPWGYPGSVTQGWGVTPALEVSWAQVSRVCVGFGSGACFGGTAPHQIYRASVVWQLGGFGLSYANTVGAVLVRPGLGTQSDTQLSVWPLVDLFNPRSVYSQAWLTGVSGLRPVRGTTEAALEPLALNAKLGTLPEAALPADVLLFRWCWSWSTLAPSYPTDKTYFGGLSGRPVAPAWGQTTQVPDFTAQGLGSGLVSKSVGSTLVPQAVHRTPVLWVPGVAAPVFDAERVLFNQQLPQVLPAPYVDVDPAYYSAKLTLGLNTTRRGNHVSRFKLGWGSYLGLASQANFQANPLGYCLVGGALTPGVFGVIPASSQDHLALLCDDAGTGRLTTDVTGLRFVGVSGDVLPTLALRHGGVMPLSALPLGGVPSRVLPQLEAWSLGSHASLRQNQVGVFASTSSKACRGSTQLVWVHSWLPRGVYPTRTGRCNPHRYSAEPLVGAQTTRNSLLRVVPNLSLDALALPVQAYQPTFTQLEGGAHRVGYTQMCDQVGSLRRLRLTRGVCLPALLPLHGVFGSKDVIHSWAIPGLGLKVDCIPGYNSHRRVFLPWRGAFWGQCMEVCGRYHHWMPVLVNVVHRDSFVAWCSIYLDGLRLSGLSADTSRAEPVSKVWDVTRV